MYLQLADNGNPQSVRPPSIMENFIWVPGQNGTDGVWVREDQLDDVSDQEFEFIMSQQPEFMGGLFSGLKQRVQNWRERRKERKEAKNQAKIAKWEAKETRFKSGEPGAGERIFNKLTGTVGKIFGGGGGEPAPPPGAQQRAMDFPVVTGQGSVGVNQFADPKNLLLIGGLIAGTILVVSLVRKK